MSTCTLNARDEGEADGGDVRDGGEGECKCIWAKSLRLLDDVFGGGTVVFYFSALNHDFALLGASANLERVLGIVADVSVMRTFWRKHIHPEEYARVVAEWRTIQAEETCSQEFRLCTDAGSYRWVKNETSCRGDGAGSYLAGCLRDVSQEKEALAALAVQCERQQATEHFYRTVLDSLPQRLFWKDRHSVFFGCNLKGAQALGLQSPGEIVGKSDYDFYRDRDEATYLRLLDEAVMEAGIATYHTEVAGRDGEIWLDVSKVPLFDQSGAPAGLLISYEDVTELKKSQLTLKKFKQAVEQSSNSVFITDVQGDIEYVNPSFLELYGYREQDVLGRNPRLLQSGLASPQTYVEMWRTILQGNSWRGELPNRKCNGEIAWQSVSISPIFDENGNILHFLAIEDDITWHKALETDLKGQIGFVQALIDSLPYPVFFKDKAGCYRRINRAFAEFAGKRCDDWIGKTAFDVFPQDIARRVADADGALMRAGGSKSLEFSVTLADGRGYDLLSHKAVFFDERGEPSGIIGSYFDITARKCVEAALVENEARLRELTSTVGEGIYVANEQQAITFVNPAAVKLLGWREDELLGHHVHGIFNCTAPASGCDLLAPPCCAAERVRRSLRTERSEDESFLRKDGSPFPVSVIASPILRDGHYAGTVVAFHDITEQKFTRSMLDDALQELRTVLDNVQIGVAYLRDGKFSWINRHMEQMFGCTIVEISTESLDVLCEGGRLSVAGHWVRDWGTRWRMAGFSRASFG